ncbi:MAG: nicotinate-nucleotide--dimethylbenzimidazole phosphoribosyltransferase [Alphaproteobacteria bacterium]|nr:nicotinate-nucleotide--dimethylbenzimidazole phosphoribosyltransferase [Alphaproteobacteria bacterium]
MSGGASGSASSLDEIRALLNDLPEGDGEAADRAGAREAQLTKPAGALGLLEAITPWLARWQGRYPPRLDRPRVAVFAGNHGVTVHGVSAFPSEVTAQMVQNFIAGGAAINQICSAMDAELRVYELALETPSADFTVEPALSEDACAQAMAYGMTAVEDGLDLICLGEMGIGNTTAAAALCHALFGGEAKDWTGPGTGVAGAELENKRRVVADGVARHKAEAQDALELLSRLGGHEIAAMTGAVIAARKGRVPVLLDGYVSTAAAAVLHAMDPGLLDHCLVAHQSAEPGHLRLLDRMDRTALLDLNMRLGEATGAALAIGILRAALACHTGMATFADAGVSERS